MAGVIALLLWVGTEHFDLAGFRPQISSLSTTVTDLYYVLHTFQKKSKTGSKTPKQEIDLVKAQLKRAEEHYREWTEKQKRETS